MGITKAFNDVLVGVLLNLNLEETITLPVPRCSPEKNVYI